MPRRLKVMLVEDNPGDARLIREMLGEARSPSIDTECCSTLAEAIARLGRDRFDAVLLDLNLPDSRGIDTFNSFFAADGGQPVVVLTGLEDEETALSAMQGGAQDFLVKGRVNAELLARSIRYAIERRQAESELRVKEQAIQSSLNAIALAGLDGRLTYVNHSALGLLGFSDEAEMLGRNITEFWGDPGMEAPVFSSLERDGSWSGEMVGRREDGSTFHALVNASIIHDESGEPSSLMAVILDVTQRKRAGDRLEELNRCLLSLGSDPRENLKMILESGGGILEAGALKYFSRMREREYVCEGSRFTEKHLGAEYPCCALEPAEGEATLTRSIPAEPPCRERHPDLDARGLAPRLAVPVFVMDGVVGALCLFDLDGRERDAEEVGLLVALGRALGIEEERFRHEESLRDFVDVASHELRHPITIMKGYAGMLRDRGEHIDEPTREIMLDIIDHGADRLNSLVGGLLDVSRIERGRFEAKPLRQPLLPLVERALEEMRLRGFNNEFLLCVAGDLGLREVDGEKLVQLLVILLENAVKYSPSGEPVEVMVEAGGPDRAVVLSVLDRGIGVPESFRERVFDRFFQVEDAPHHSTPGMGMGLYIARNIAEAHGGRAWCEPREGGGSAFRFELPREAEGEAADTYRIRQAGPGRRGRHGE